MGLTAVKALCDCNGTEQSSRQAFECFVSAKDILPSCTPILKATVRTKCGARRMLLSTFILLLIMAVIYCLSFANHHRHSLRLPFRRQPRSQAEPVTEPSIQASQITQQDTIPEETILEETAPEDTTPDAETPQEE